MEFRTPWGPAPVVAPAPPTSPTPPKLRGRRPAKTKAALAEAGLPWLYHHLTVSGPAEPVTTFAAAARGSGIVPWRLEAVRIEEDIFNLAASQPSTIRSLTIEGCRILARQVRERVGRSRACPFDLNTLLPCRLVSLSLG